MIAKHGMPIALLLASLALNGPLSSSGRGDRNEEIAYHHRLCEGVRSRRLLRLRRRPGYAIGGREVSRGRAESRVAVRLPLCH